MFLNTTSATLNTRINSNLFPNSLFHNVRQALRVSLFPLNCVPTIYTYIVNIQNVLDQNSLSFLFQGQLFCILFNVMRNQSVFNQLMLIRMLNRVCRHFSFSRLSPQRSNESSIYKNMHIKHHLSSLSPDPYF